MANETHSTDREPGAPTTAAPPSKPGLIRSIAHRLAGDRLALPIEGRLASFDGATGWLNSEPLTPEVLRGRVVLVDFWTYTCVNWLRTLPYVRAWDAKYRDDGLTVIGVHTPEFSFERNIDNVVAQSRTFDVEYPIAVDSDHAVWTAFANHFWPAVYIADVEGRIRHHHLGEGEYAQTEMLIQQLLLDAGANGIEQDLVEVEPRGLEVAADWRTLQSPETYVGMARAPASRRRTSRPSTSPMSTPHPHRYVSTTGAPGNWTVARHAAVLNEAGGRVCFQFHARDLNLVVGSASGGASSPFRVFLDGQVAEGAHGSDVESDGRGIVMDQRTYQLIRQPGPIADRLFEIEFLDAGVEAYCFTFG